MARRRRKPRRNRLFFFFGFGWTGSGATLAVPGPVGGVVLGAVVGASRDAPAAAMELSGAGGGFGTSEGGMMFVSLAGLDGLSEGSVVGAGLGTVVSPRLFLSSA